VILFEGWRYFPFAFLFILARLQAIPDELYQAASVDGASPFQRFFYITVPQLATVLSTLFLFRFIWTINKFDDIFLLTRGQAGTKVLTIKVYDYAFGEFNIGAGSAVAMVLFGILSVFLFIYFRWITREE
jgi:multiple sugar transport system permease protein